MKKKNILNALMVLIVVVIAISGVMAVKSLKGPAVTQTENSVSANQQTAQLAADKTGIVTVERKGIAYEVDTNSAVRTGDIYRSKINSSLTVYSGGNKLLALGADTQFKVNDAETREFILNKGEIFADTRQSESPVLIATDKAVFTSHTGVFSVTVQPSSHTVYVYSGEVAVSGENIAGNVTVQAGHSVLILCREDGTVEVTNEGFAASVLSDWQISTLQKCNMDSTFWPSDTDLKNVVNLRQAEKTAAQQAQLLLTRQAKDHLKQEQQEYEKAKDNALQNGTGTSVSNPSDNDGTASDGNTDAKTKYCTIEIRCDTILDNMENLTAGKEGYVPSSGTIIATSKIAFEDGETVFEVLKRACDATGTQLEYRYTPLYESYYIEGINHIYEFDCGFESGWMYKVNGWFPNYGCSSYKLSDGDVIVWVYTCNGLGADVQ